jgi:preprotein translocase subunit SecB
VQIANDATKVADSIFEVTVGVTVTARVGERTLFLVEAVQAGLFQIANVPETEMGPLLGIGCPTILYPYARETVSDMVTRAGFPPVVLAPVSFEAIYAQRMQQSGDDARIEIAS